MIPNLERYNQLLASDRQNPEISITEKNGLYICHLYIQGIDGIGSTEDEAIEDAQNEFTKEL